MTFNRDDVEAVYRVRSIPNIAAMIIGAMIGLTFGAATTGNRGLALVEALAGAGIGGAFFNYKKYSAVYLRQHPINSVSNP